MNDDFYRAFEDKFRGSRELIKSRLQVYLPFVQPLLLFHPSAKAVDLGCGRGEWLELLTENGFEAQGVDLDDAMLSACRERGLCVQTGDALVFLRALPDQSQAIVSGFHIAEHLPFKTLQALVQDALRVLVPGGLLILETPNPENLVTGTSVFYLDPTHLRPLPPQLLAFLPEYTGFKRSKVLRLQESPDLSKGSISLLNVLNGVSLDYAVVAQKEGTEDMLTALQPTFEAEYGLTLEALANRYQQQAEDKAQQAEDKAQQAEDKAQQAEDKAQQAEAASTQALMQLQAVYTSTSWRFTAPLRAASSFVRKFSPKRLKPVIEQFLKHAALYVNRRPQLRKATIGVLNRFPAVKYRLVSVVNGAYQAPATPPSVPLELAHLSPHARRIHADLKAALARRQQGGR